MPVAVNEAAINSQIGVVTPTYLLGEWTRRISVNSGRQVVGNEAATAGLASTLVKIALMNVGDVVLDLVRYVRHECLVEAFGQGCILVTAVVALDENLTTSRIGQP